jgi:mannose-6-phosphate isomerase
MGSNKLTTLSLDSLTTLSLGYNPRMSEEREQALCRLEDARSVLGSDAAPADASPSGDASNGRAATAQAAGPAPMLLPANPVFRFYKGGAGIDSFRGVEPGSGPGAPEDWVASTTTSFGSDSEGLAALQDGRLLRDLIDSDPAGFLGAAHVAALGSNPGLLVKLLDAGERLSVHFHPDREFARAHLHSEFGKTEAWLILEAEPGAHMHLGLRESIDLQTLNSWVEDQDSEVMLQALNKVPVSAGDALFVPAGTLHTIGSGITLIELQEPSDMSVVVEWRNAGVSNGDEHLQLGWDTILPAAYLDVAAPIHVPARLAEPEKSSLKRLLPPEADSYFRAEQLTLHQGEPLQLQPQFSIVIGTGGELTVNCQVGESVQLVTGTAVLIPFGAGMTTLSGAGTAIRCLPPVVGAGESSR